MKRGQAHEGSGSGSRRWLLWASVLGLFALWASGGPLACSRGLECRQDADCSTDKPFCVAALCSPCTKDSDCGPGKRCDLEGLRCVDGAVDGSEPTPDRPKVDKGPGEPSDKPAEKPAEKPKEALPDAPPAQVSCIYVERRACYTGKAGTQGIGNCKAGIQVKDSSGKWGACLGQRVPSTEICDGSDNDCDGNIDEGCSTCLPVTLDHSLIYNRYSTLTAERGLLRMGPKGKRLAFSWYNSDYFEVWDLDKGEREQIFLSHANAITGLSFCHDGKSLASGARDGTWRLHDLELGFRVLGQDLGKNGARGITSLALHPTKPLLATLTADGILQLWKLDEPTKEPQTAVTTRGAAQLAFSSDGTYLAFRAGSQIFLWNTVTSSISSFGEGHTRGTLIYDLAFHPTSPTLASIGSDRFVHLWDAKSRKKVREITRLSRLGSRGTGVDFHPNGQQLATASTANLLQVWDPNKASQTAPQMKVQDPGQIFAVAYAKDGQSVATLSGALRLREASTGKLLKTLHLGYDLDTNPTEVHLSDDGRRLFYISGARSYVWDVEKRTLLDDFLHINILVTPAGALSPDGKFAASSAGNVQVEIRDLRGATAQQYARIPNANFGHVVSLGFSPDSRYLLIYYNNVKMVLWDTQTKARAQTYSPPSAVLLASARPDSQQLATTHQDGVLRLWNINNPQPTSLGQVGKVAWMRYSPDGKRLLTLHDKSLKIWNLTSGKVAQTLPNAYPSQSLFSAKGQWIAYATQDKKLQIWDTSTQKNHKLLEFPAKSLPATHYGSMAFHPTQEDILVVGGLDKRLYFWDVRRGALLHVQLEHPEATGRLHFSKDGKRLVSVGTNVVQVWQCPCTPKQTRPCLGAQTNASKCQQGTQSCNPRGRWNACIGGQLPQGDRNPCK